MSAELIVLSVGAAAAALIVTRVLSLRADARRVARSTGTRTRSSWARRDRRSRKRSGRRRSHERTSEAGDPPRSGAAGWNGPMIRRPLEDKARRKIAYLLIALLALMIVALLTGVVFGVIPVSEIEEFDVILGPLVALVSAATGFYFASKR